MKQVSKVFNTRPVPKPRMTQRDKWAKRDCVVRYYSFKDEITYQSKHYEVPDSIRVTFGIPFPKSYSKKKKVELLGKPHQIKPDVDNLVKALLDSLKDKDQSVWRVDARKIWTSGDGFIEVEEIDD